MNATSTIHNRGVIRLSCCECGKRLARDGAAAAEDRASDANPDRCGGCDPSPDAVREFASAWSGL